MHIITGEVAAKTKRKVSFECLFVFVMICEVALVPARAEPLWQHFVQNFSYFWPCVKRGHRGIEFTGGIVFRHRWCNSIP